MKTIVLHFISDEDMASNVLQFKPQTVRVCLRSKVKRPKSKGFQGSQNTGRSSKTEQNPQKVADVNEAFFWVISIKLADQTKVTKENCHYSNFQFNFGWFSRLQNLVLRIFKSVKFSIFKILGLRDDNLELWQDFNFARISKVQNTVTLQIVPYVE